MDPMEEVRQRLMTHLWSGMVRKDKAMTIIDDLDDYPNADYDDEGDNKEVEEGEEKGQAGDGLFPVTFASTSAVPGPSSGQSAFPGLEEMRRRIEEEDGYGVEPGKEEYERLEDWLEEEDFMDIPRSGNMAEIVGDREGGEGEEADDRGERREMSDLGDKGFDDDFDDFAPFQSPPPKADGLLSMDPTPLLLHLQSVRAELAGVGDEDQRRIRAGREVERVMRDLGMGGMGFPEEDFGDG